MVLRIVLQLTLTTLVAVCADTLILRQADQRSFSFSDDEHIAQTEKEKILLKFI
jgi:hypothetical protein